MKLSNKTITARFTRATLDRYLVYTTQRTVHRHWCQSWTNDPHTRGGAGVFKTEAGRLGGSGILGGPVLQVVAEELEDLGGLAVLVLGKLLEVLDSV